ncbi:hypothetical protein ACW9HQ_49190, partial [Nocardia gipuzkoensis]
RQAASDYSQANPWLVWTREPSPKWAQYGLATVGLIAMWIILRSLLAFYMLARWDKGNAAEYYVLARGRIDATLANVAVCTAAGIFLGLWSISGVVRSGKPTAVLADLATVAAVVGLVYSAPRSYSSARRAMKKGRRSGIGNYLQIPATLLVVDICIIMHLLVNLPLFFFGSE